MLTAAPNEIRGNCVSNAGCEFETNANICCFRRKIITVMKIVNVIKWMQLPSCWK
jgi:hypothetical protein